MGPDEDLVSLIKPSFALYGDQGWLRRVTKTGFHAVKEELQGVRGSLTELQPFFLRMWVTPDLGFVRAQNLPLSPPFCSFWEFSLSVSPLCPFPWPVVAGHISEIDLCLRLVRFLPNQSQGCPSSEQTLRN